MGNKFDYVWEGIFQPQKYDKCRVCGEPIKNNGYFVMFCGRGFCKQHALELSKNGK